MSTIMASLFTMCERGSFSPRPSNLLFLSLFLAAPFAAALNNGLALTPPMSYSSWFDMSVVGPSGCGSDVLLKETVDAFFSTGLRESGYEFFGIDCYYTRARNFTGDSNLIPDDTLFPGGFQELTNYIQTATGQSGRKGWTGLPVSEWKRNVAALAETKKTKPSRKERAWRTESAMVVGWASASPRSALNFIETVFETPRSSIVTP